jgi:anhydro-N-acetylmuramic acid kinase
MGRTADVLGFHGQTILHAPERHRTWQIGDAALLAHICRIPVVHDFRSADVAAGGQGAPFAPLFHAALATSLPKPLLIINIGGVSNITYLGEHGDILACDTGPGNGPLDDLAQLHLGQPYDKDGALAASGHIDAARLQTLLSHPYFALPAPKSLDRLTFSALIAEATANLRPADAAATLAAFAVAAIVQTPLPAAPQRVLVCGGGRKNPVLMAGLRHEFAVPVQPVEAAGWDGDALEAQCFAPWHHRRASTYARRYSHPLAVKRIIPRRSHPSHRTRYNRHPAESCPTGTSQTGAVPASSESQSVSLGKSATGTYRPGAGQNST